MRIFVIQKKPIKITVMEEKSNIRTEKNYRVTMILKEEIIVMKCYKLDIAAETLQGMRRIFPKLFVGGAIEEKKEKWEVIGTLRPAAEEE